MLGRSPPIAFLATADRARARTFFSGVLGLQLKEQAPFADVFDACGIDLRITPVDELRPAAHTVLGWAVDDIGGVMDALRAKGVAFERFEGLPQQEDGIARFPDGAQVCWFKDPDGNLLSLTQHPDTRSKAS